MIIIKVKGRLGNQMFDYALYKQLHSMGKVVKLDFSQLYLENIKNELTVFTGLDCEQATADDIARLGDCKKDLISKIRRKIGFRKKSHIYEKNMEFLDGIFEIDNAYLEGFWQSEKYFPDVREQLLEDFSFRVAGENNCRIIEQMKSTVSVSLHIRRGDYLEKKFRGIYGGICTERYYKSAIEYFKSRFLYVKFFVFSDDKEWAKKTFAGDDFLIVEGNGGDQSYMDMCLMSQCKHNIIANSSFSWWGAWLNQNPSKIVIAPDRWLNNCEARDVCNPEWVRIGGEEK